MAVFNIFKKKKEKKEEITKPVKEIRVKVAEASPHLPEAKPVEKPKEEIPSEKPSADRVKKSAEVRPPQVKREVRTGRAYRILKSPHVTEKSTALAEKNQYVFKVYPKTNKIEIKTAVEDLYNVDVLSVRIIKVRPKRRRLGRISGWRAGYKKAVVKIKAGQKIEVMPR